MLPELMAKLRNENRGIHRNLMAKRRVFPGVDYDDVESCNGHAAYEAGVVDMLRGGIAPGSFGAYRNAYTQGVSDAENEC